MPEVSRLPSAMQKRLADLEAAGVPPTDQTTPPATPPADTPPATPPADTPPASNGDTVQVSRDVYNGLVAAAERANTATARADRAGLRVEELEHRLTQLENAAKAVPVPAAPAAPTPPADVELTADEQKDFEDSIPLIRKVAAHEASKLIHALRTELTAQITEAVNTAKGVATTVQQTAHNAFSEALRKRVPDLREIITHQHWPAFLDAEDAVSGFTYEQLIAKNVQSQKLEPLVNIYKTFRDKYMEPVAAPTGYSGANPSGGAVQPPADPQKPAKLKMSDRVKASEDYRKGKITYEQLQEVDKKFAEAEKNGNVDNNA